MQYTAVIRTLGTAGDKYQQLLDSLIKQTIKPSAIIVYIAEGYSLPKETVGIEQYVYVKKGMLAQRALSYDEVKTEYILFLDDDLLLSTNAVAQMFEELRKNNADVISPDIFPNSQRPFFARMMMTLSGRMRARRNDDMWAYKVMRNGGYSYNIRPQKKSLFSQTNAGASFLCRKDLFLKIRLQDELWVDQMSYPLGEDQVMYYKMYKTGLRQLTLFNHSFIHLDAGGSLVESQEKIQKRLYGDLYFKTVFWHRFIYKPERSLVLKLWDVICLGYMYCFTILISLIKFEFTILKTKWSAMVDGWAFIRSDKYKQLPLIK